MNFLKKNMKLIIGFIVGILLAGGIGAYATYNYFAKDIKYTDEMSVQDALNDLYKNKKETTDEIKNITTNGTQTLDKYYKNLNVNVPIPDGYISPSGTKTITEKGSRIDVSNYEYADTTGLYTESEIQSGKGTHWNSGTFQSVPGENTIPVGFNPNKFVVIRHDTGGTLLFDRNETSSQYWCMTTSVHVKANIDASRNSFGIMSIGENTKIYISIAGITWKWFAIK